MIKVLIIITATIYIQDTHAFRTAVYPLGGLFNRLSLGQSEEVFDKQAKRMKGTYSARTLFAKVVDSYSTSLELCPFTSDTRGIAALLDVRPTNGICDMTCLLCNRLNITHLSVDWEHAETFAEDLFTFYYHPSPQLISTAYAALIKHLKWDKFTILYEDDSSFIRLQEIINSWSNPMEPILFRKLNPDEDNRETFKYVLKVAHINYHVLDCHVNNIRKYMEQIVQVDNSTEYQSFILTNLDAYAYDLKTIPLLMANISTLHLTTSNDHQWIDMGMNTNEPLQLETALVADALTHIEKAMRSKQLEGLRDLTDPPSLCIRDSKSEYDNYIWPLGAQLRSALSKTTITGFTGFIEFDEQYGTRKNFKLHLSKLNRDSEFVYDGDWDSNTNIITIQNMVDDRSTASNLNTKTMIATRFEKPYFYKTESGNGTYKGYAKDLIAAIFERINRDNKLDLQFEIYPVPGNHYGNPIAGTKKWNGVIGELIEHKAALGICDLTITAERNAVVDFSIPFMTLGISMLYKEPKPEDPDMFSFLKPLGLDVWLYLATAYIIASFMLLICARMCEDDWVNPHPCNQNPDSLQNIWSLYNCTWLTMGSIMTQGCDILPRAAGSRWMTGIWWFFAMIVTASYTANMSAFLRASRRSTEIKNVNDLADQNEISYGTLFNGSTYKFFKDSNDSVYTKIWTTMISTKPSVFTKNNYEGKDRVVRSKGKYAFFMESTAIEYFKNRDCDLKMVGSKLDSKEYGIAMPKNYIRKGQVDNAILSLQEDGTLEELKKKWWEEEDNDSNCEAIANEEDDNGSLKMKNTSGIFLVLGTGGIIGLFVAVADFMLHARQISVKEGVTFYEALASEWRASLDPRQLHKLAAPPRSAPPSGSPSPSRRERSQSRAVSVLRAATSLINFKEIY